MPKSELVIVVPSRGRPGAATELLEAFIATCTADTRLVVAVDQDDPTAADYPDGTWTAPTRGMVSTLNWAVNRTLEELQPFAIGFMGDDHRPTTRGWDARYLRELHELHDQCGAGIVYGNDLIQGKRLPTQVAMTASIPRALGHLAPERFGHLFVDNVWKAWGEGAGCLRYLDDVIVQHLHPVTGQVEWDEGHKRVNSPSQHRADKTAWVNYQQDELGQAVASIRALRGVTE